MNAQSPIRGAHLLADGRRFRGGTGLLARLFAGPLERLIDRIDAGLAFGTLDARLPDGSRRLLGGRGAGPVAVVHLRDWRAMLRLTTGGSVGWYQAWEAG